jgi:outer membrane immunogenic protein
MKRILQATVAATALMTITLGAQAADLPPRPMMPAYAPAVVAPVYNWTGIYFGFNGGYGWGQQDPFNIITDRFDSLSTNISGGVIGGTMGAQIQSGHVVLGIEADIDWANIKGSTLAIPTIAGVAFPGGAVNAATNITWESTARARVGFANENWLFYATGGMAVLGANTSLTTVTGGAACAAILLNCSGANRQIGAALGAGLEYGFTANLSAKLEYLYISAASLAVSSHNEVRAGLNYRFGGL